MHSPWLIVLLLVGALLVPLAASGTAALGTPQTLTPHDPIVIDGNGDFIAANGVTGGHGTAADPYVIEGWDIGVAATASLEIRNTNAHVVVRDVFIHNVSCPFGPNRCYNPGLTVIRASNVRIEHVTVWGMTIGMMLGGVVHVSIADSLVVGDDIGINVGASCTYPDDCVPSDDVSIVSNNVSRFLPLRTDLTPSGIYAAGQGLIVANNTVRNFYQGVSAASGDNALVTGNRIEGNGSIGILLYNTTYAQLTFNEVRISNEANPSAAMGILLVGTYRNSLSDNTVEVSGGWGIVSNTSPWKSIFHNDIVNATFPAWDEEMGGAGWDAGYPDGGNYWVGYAGVDACRGSLQDDCSSGDGIGDTPYAIPAATQDRYPLMAPAVVRAPPLANFSVDPAQATTGAIVHMDASTSTGAVLYRWDWQDDGLWDTAWSATRAATASFSQDGLYSIRLQAMSPSGLTADAVHSVLVDGTPPTTTVSLEGDLGDNGWYTSAVSVHLRAMDASVGVASIAVSVDGQSWLPTPGNQTLLILTDGSHTVEYRSTDKLGNLEASQSISVSVDTQRPWIVGVPSSMFTSRSDVSLRWLARDNTSGVARAEVSVDSGAYVPAADLGNATVHLTDGIHSVRVRVTDAAGNQAMSDIRIQVDTNPLSPSGPYQGVPLYGVVAAVVFVGLVLLWRRRIRLHRSPPGNP